MSKATVPQTEQELLNVSLEQTRRQLLQSEKMAAIGQLAGLAGHIQSGAEHRGHAVAAHHAHGGSGVQGAGGAGGRLHGGSAGIRGVAVLDLGIVGGAGVGGAAIVTTATATASAAAAAEDKQGHR